MYRYLLHILVLLFVAFPLRAEDDDFDPPHPGDPNAAYRLVLQSSPADMATLTGAGTYPNNSQVSINCQPAEGYVFEAWMKDEQVFATTARYTFLMPSENLTLTAQLRKLELQTISVGTNLPAAAECTGGGEYYPGRTVQIACAPNTDYNFQYWTLNGEIYSYRTSFYYTVEASNAAFEAVFTYTPHATLSIRSDDAAAGYVSNTGGRYLVGEQVTTTAIAYTDYLFTHWLLNGEQYATTEQIIYTVRETDDELVAVFEYDPIHPDEPQVELTSVVRLETSPAGAATFNIATAGKYAEGSTLLIRAQMNSGYIFEGWYLGEQCVAKTLDFAYVVGKNDATLTLRATQIIYTRVVLKSDPVGAVTFNIQSEATYEAGTELAIRAAVQPGYLFDGWYLGEQLLTNNVDLHFTVPEQGTILTARANYIPTEDDEEEEEWDPLPPGEPQLETADITVLPNDATMGKTLGTASHVVGDTVTVQAIAFNGYLFEQWSDGVTDATRTIIVEDDLTLVAYFAPQMYQVTVVADDEQMGSVVGSGMYAYRSNATIVAYPADGYRFMKWSDENTQQVHNIYVTCDTTIIAYFAPVQYQITVLTPDERLGTVSGSGWYSPGDTITISATPAEGGEFIMWSDGVMDNPREVIVVQDDTYTALFSGGAYSGVEEGLVEPSGNEASKIIRNGQLFILRAGKEYDVIGRVNGGK